MFAWSCTCLHSTVTSHVRFCYITKDWVATGCSHDSACYRFLLRHVCSDCARLCSLSWEECATFVTDVYATRWLITRFTTTAWASWLCIWWHDLFSSGSILLSPLGQTIDIYLLSPLGHTMLLLLSPLVKTVLYVLSPLGQTMLYLLLPLWQTICICLQSPRTYNVISA